MPLFRNRRRKVNRNNKVVRFRKPVSTVTTVRRTKNHFVARPGFVMYISPKGTNSPIPDTYRCKIESSFHGFDSAVATGHYTVRLNKIFEPWNTANQFPNASKTLAGLMPVGFKTLCNGRYYTSYRVYSARMDLEMCPESAVDSVVVTITPSADPSQPVSASQAQGQRYTKELVSMSGRTSHLRTGSRLTNSITISKWLGLSKEAIRDDLSYQYMGDYNGVIGPVAEHYMVVNWSTMDDENLESDLEYVVKMTWFVEFFDARNTLLES